MSLKEFIKKNLPFSKALGTLYHGLLQGINKQGLNLESRQDTFSRYYKTNRWKDTHSKSGEGSNLEQTRV